MDLDDWVLQIRFVGSMPDRFTFWLGGIMRSLFFWLLLVSSMAFGQNINIPDANFS